jgi:hypothetical protein
MNILDHLKKEKSWNSGPGAGTLRHPLKFWDFNPPIIAIVKTALSRLVLCLFLVQQKLGFAKKMC